MPLFRIRCPKRQSQKGLISHHSSYNSHGTKRDVLPYANCVAQDERLHAQSDQEQHYWPIGQ